MPGKEASKYETAELSGAPNSLLLPENSFELVSNWACTSKPTTLFQFLLKYSSKVKVLRWLVTGITLLTLK